MAFELDKNWLTSTIVLGTVVFSGYSKATASTGPAAVDLGTLPGHGISETIAINDRGRSPASRTRKTSRP